MTPHGYMLVDGTSNHSVTMVMLSSWRERLKLASILSKVSPISTILSCMSDAYWDAENPFIELSNPNAEDINLDETVVELSRASVPNGLLYIIARQFCLPFHTSELLPDPNWQFNSTHRIIAAIHGDVVIIIQTVS